MSTGILLAILTGMSWTLAGIIISRCAKEKFSLCSYSFLHTLFSGILSFILFSHFSFFTFSRNILFPAGIVFLAGILNASAQFFVRLAMKKGNHAPVWAMMQCCMLFPFLAGICFFGEKTNPFTLCGILLMLCGIIFPALKEVKKIREYFLPAWIALLLFGASQILYLVCSCIKSFSDPAVLRPALVCFGNMTAWSILIKLEEKKWEWNRKIFLLAFVMAFVHAGGLYIFFKALDLLSMAGKGNIAIPLIMGSNIGMFSLYGFLILRQKNSFMEILAIFAILAGLIFSALGSA